MTEIILKDVEVEVPKFDMSMILGFRNRMKILFFPAKKVRFKADNVRFVATVCLHR